MSLRPEGAGRDGAADIGVVQRVELRPKDVGLERQRRDHAPLLVERPRVALHVVEGEIRVPRRLIEPATEVGDDPFVDEGLIRQHAVDAAAVDRGREQLREAQGAASTSGFSRTKWT